MTVCIGAFSKDGTYVTVSDMALSEPDRSVLELATCKVSDLGSHALLCYSGSASEKFRTLYAPGMEERQNLNKHYKAFELIALLETAYRDTRESWANAYLSKFGMTRNEFYKFGSRRLSTQLYVETHRYLEDEWCLQLLVGGFDVGTGSSFIFTIDTDSRAQIDVDIPFASIGIGEDAADTILRNSFRTANTKFDVIARLLEAKFYSEPTPYIGKATAVIAVGSDGKREVLFSAQEPKWKRIWERNSLNYMNQSAKEVPKHLFEYDALKQFWEEYQKKETNS